MAARAERVGPVRVLGIDAVQARGVEPAESRREREQELADRRLVVGPVFLDAHTALRAAALGSEPEASTPPGQGRFSDGMNAPASAPTMPTVKSSQSNESRHTVICPFTISKRP